MTGRDMLAALGVEPADVVSQRARLTIDFAVLPAIWLPCPPAFPAGADVTTWASESAELWWENSGLKHRRKDVTLLAETLAGIHGIIYAPDTPLFFHFALLHLPERISPLPVMFGVWPTVGDRDTQLNTLTGIGSPDLAKPPIVEEFRTGRLGSGLKVMAYTRFGQGPGIGATISYAWRSEELQTALRIFAAGGDLGRIERALPDLDTLAHATGLAPK
ncbi:MAG: hypothetical protein J2P32_17300 [Actinobacteria bacterium]|nr:hypothetical protein [Actinomycetota bacterium]